MSVIRIKPPARPRKPTAPRTCCPTHRDTCNFGRQHVWAGPFYLDDGTWSHPDDVKCFDCDGVCTAGRPVPTDSEVER